MSAGTKQLSRSPRPLGALRVRNQRGAPLIEFAILVPFLIIILMFTFESGRILYSYLIVSHIAAEGTRFTAQINPLPQTCFGTNENFDEQTPPIDNTIAHWLTQERVRVLLGAYGSRLPTIRESDPEKPGGDIDTQFISATSPLTGCPNTANKRDVVSVRIRFRYVPIVFPFLDIPITTEITGPYLINNEQFPISTGPPIAGTGGTGATGGSG